MKKRICCILLAVTCFMAGGLTVHWLENRPGPAAVPQPAYVFDYYWEMELEAMEHRHGSATAWLADVHSDDENNVIVYVKEGTVPATVEYVGQCVRHTNAANGGPAYKLLEVRETPTARWEQYDKMELLRSVFAAACGEPLGEAMPWLVVCTRWHEDTEEYRFHAALNADGVPHTREQEAQLLHILQLVCGDDIIWEEYIEPWTSGLNPAYAQAPYNTTPPWA